LLLEKCLTMVRQDVRMIDRTVLRLPVQNIMPFLRWLVVKLESRPNRSDVLILWVRSILHSHTPYLLSAPELREVLSGLYQTIDDRLSNFKKILSLYGRLRLLLSQTAASKRAASFPVADDNSVTTAAGAAAVDGDGDGPLAVFTETDDGDSLTRTEGEADGTTTTSTKRSIGGGDDIDVDDVQEEEGQEPEEEAAVDDVVMGAAADGDEGDQESMDQEETLAERHDDEEDAEGGDE